MVSWNYFADDRPPGHTPMALVSATRYPAHARQLSVGQNIGWGTGEYATPASIVAAWMADPPHREIILTGEYRDAGVGVTAGRAGPLRTGTAGRDLRDRVRRAPPLGAPAARAARHATALGARL